MLGERISTCTSAHPVSPIVWAAWAERSSTPRPNGPRSFTRTTTERPVARSVTRSIVLNASHGLAQVSLLGSKISPSAVRWPANPGPYQLASPLKPPPPPSSGGGGPPIEVARSLRRVRSAASWLAMLASMLWSTAWRSAIARSRPRRAAARRVTSRVRASARVLSSDRWRRRVRWAMRICRSRSEEDELIRATSSTRWMSSENESEAST
jgi:hypothetical protein